MVDIKEITATEYHDGKKYIVIDKFDFVSLNENGLPNLR